MGDTSIVHESSTKKIDLLYVALWVKREDTI